jgi:hypothetical protein
MATRIEMLCDGCGEVVRTERVRAQFRSVSGRSYGFGSYHEPSITDAVHSTGWVWCDPYTSCTYCPECWAEIEKGKSSEAMSASQ